MQNIYRISPCCLLYLHAALLHAAAHLKNAGEMCRNKMKKGNIVILLYYLYRDLFLMRYSACVCADFCILKTVIMQPQSLITCFGKQRCKKFAASVKELIMDCTLN